MMINSRSVGATKLTVEVKREAFGDGILVGEFRLPCRSCSYQASYTVGLKPLEVPTCSPTLRIKVAHCLPRETVSTHRLHTKLNFLLHYRQKSKEAAKESLIRNRLINRPTHFRFEIIRKRTRKARWGRRMGKRMRKREKRRTSIGIREWAKRLRIVQLDTIEYYPVNTIHRTVGRLATNSERQSSPLLAETVKHRFFNTSISAISLSSTAGICILEFSV